MHKLAAVKALGVMIGLPAVVGTVITLCLTVPGFGEGLLTYAFGLFIIAVSALVLRYFLGWGRAVVRDCFGYLYRFFGGYENERLCSHLDEWLYFVTDSKGLMSTKLNPRYTMENFESYHIDYWPRVDKATAEAKRRGSHVRF